MANELAEGAAMILELRRNAKDFDQKHKAFIAWCRYQEMLQRQKRGGMGKGFDDMGGEGDDGGES